MTPLVHVGAVYKNDEEAPILDHFVSMKFQMHFGYLLMMNTNVEDETDVIKQAHNSFYCNPLIIKQTVKRSLRKY